MAPLAGGSARTLNEFLRNNVELGATVITDGWSGYNWLSRIGYVHDRRSQRAARARGEDPESLLPAVHRVASLSKRWLLGTHQGAVEDAHLPAYLDEFVFRFIRRTSRSRGMLFIRTNSLWAMSPSDTMRHWRAALLVRCRRYPRESGGNLRVSRGRERDVPGAQAERRQVCVTAPYPLAEWEAE